MSDRPCNRCHFDDMKRRADACGQSVEVRNSDEGWAEVYVDGRFRASFMRLPTFCAC